MGSSRFLPLVIAGLVGLFVGWLFGPDVDDVERHVNRRIDKLEEKIDAASAPVAAMQTTVASLDQRTTAIATGVQALGNPTEAVGALGAKLDAAGAAAAEGKGATDALAQKVDALSAKLDAMAAAPAAGGGQADALAAQIGNTGAVLLAGQTAIFGEKRLTVASVEGDAVSLGVEGAAPANVAAGASVDLGDGCSVSLAGVSGPAAYLAPTGCSTGGAAPAAEAPAPAGAPAQTAAAPAEAPAPAAAAPAAAPAPAAAAPAPSPDGTQLLVGQTGTFGDKRAFLSRLSAADNTAFLFIPGSGQKSVATGAEADLGDGCKVTLVSIEGTTATFKADGCGGGAPADAAAAAPAETAATAAPAEPAAPAAPAEAAAPAAPAEPAPAPAAEAAAAPAAPADAADAPAPTQAAPGGPAALTVGQTATFGEKRIFLSRVTPEKVFVVVVGTGPAEVAPGASADLGGGCSAKLDSISGNVANFTPAGC